MEMQAVKSIYQNRFQNHVHPDYILVPRAAVETLARSLGPQTFQSPQGAAPEFDPDIFLKEWGDVCKIDYRLTPQTVENYVRHVRRLLDFLKKHPSRATRQELRLFLMGDPAEYAVKTLRVLYGRYLGSDLASGFKVPRSVPRPVIVPTHDQLGRTYAKLKTTEARASFLLFATSALRPHELIELTPSQIDFERRMILPPSRNLNMIKFQWVTFFNREAEAALAELIAERSPLPNEKIFRQCRDNYTKRFRTASEPTGIRITAQLLRDWFCCEMGRLKVPDRYVDAFCGRVPKRVLEKHYTDYSPERLKEIYDGADLRVLNGGAKQ